MIERCYYKLRPGETVIGGTDEKFIVFRAGGFLLTDQRAIHIDLDDLESKAGVRSMNLEDIDAIETSKISHPFYILLTVFSVLLLAVFGELTSGSLFGNYISLGCAIYFMFMYFFTRGEVLRLVSSDSYMMLNVTKLFEEEVETIVEEIDQARSNRIEELAQSET